MPSGMQMYLVGKDIMQIPQCPKGMDVDIKDGIGGSIYKVPCEGMDNSEVSFNCDRYSRPDLQQNDSMESQKVDQTGSKIFL